MKKYIKIIAGIVVLVIIFAYLGTKSVDRAQGFNLGFIGILSGDYASVGENVRNGVVLANEEYNKLNPDSKINLTIEDDGFSGAKGVSAYQKLIAVDKINALINTSTPTIDGIYTVASKTQLPIIQLGEQGMDPADDNVFGIFPSSIVSEYDYGVYLRNKGVKEMTIVYTNMDAMIRFVDSFKKGFQGKTNDFLINTDEKDFRTHAVKVAALKPENIGFFIFPQQGSQFIKEFNKISKNKPQLFFDANFQSGYADYKRLLGDLNILNGAIVGTVDSTLSDSFKIAYKTRFGTEPGFLSDMGYDAFNLLAKTYSSDQKKWLENIKTIKYDGVGGEVQFDETGNRKPKTKMMIIKNGELADIE